MLGLNKLFKAVLKYIINILRDYVLINFYLFVGHIDQYYLETLALMGFNVWRKLLTLP